MTPSSAKKYQALLNNLLPALIVVTFLCITVLVARNFSSHTPAAPVPICKDCNIILVSFDTLRAANVHFLGYPRNTTPNMDALARNSYVFSDDIAVAPWTVPSAASVLTGVYPSVHKVLNTHVLLPGGQEKASSLADLSPDLQTLPEVLQSFGYHTAAFTGGAGVDRSLGFDKGFETFVDDGTFVGLGTRIPGILAWIANHRSEKLFLYLHAYDVHGQFVPAGGYDRRFVDFPYKGTLTGSAREQESLREEGVTRGEVFLTHDDVRFLTDLYDEKIQRADSQLASFLSAYRNLGLNDKTILIVTSEHGDEFYEHGNIDHGHSLYDELIHVPLIINVPGQIKSDTVQSQVRNIDLMPTVFALIGITPDGKVRSQMQGTSLIPLMEGKQLHLDVYPETDYRFTTFQRALVRWDGWKLISDIQTGHKELYNLASDPGEKKNLYGHGYPQESELQEALSRHLESFSP